jgi:hypothetical protein
MDLKKETQWHVKMLELSEEREKELSDKLNDKSLTMTSKVRSETEKMLIFNEEITDRSINNLNFLRRVQ